MSDEVALALAPAVRLADTAVQMLDTAERLFAENGIDKVSIREIVRASGQSNLSAAHYHFGNREALIGTLLARRVRAINVIRHQRMNELVAAGRDDSVYAIAAASVTPLGEVISTTDWGPYYVRVMAQALFTHDAEVWRHLDPATLSGHTRVRDMLRRLLPDMPARVFKDRIWMLNYQATYAFARWIHSYGPITSANRSRFSTLVRHTADFLAGGMAAPASPPEAGPGRPRM